MYWNDDRDDDKPFRVPDRVVDLSFGLRGRSLPVDHAWALAQAVGERLPWFADAPGCGLHLIHLAESGNGWIRPSDGAELLYLPRRARLTLRLPQQRVEAAQALAGTSFEIDGERFELEAAPRARLLATGPTLYARYVVTRDDDEERFIAESVTALRALDLRFKKVLCGRPLALTTPDGPLRTQSLMVSDLPPEDAVRLQEIGIGPARTLGCGLFIAHKSV